MTTIYIYVQCRFCIPHWPQAPSPVTRVLAFVLLHNIITTSQNTVLSSNITTSHHITQSSTTQHNISNMSLYVHLAFFLAIALFMQLDADVLRRYFDIDLDSDRSGDRDGGAVDIDVDRRLQEEDEVGGFGLQIQLITDDGFVPELPESSSTTSAIVLVLLVATVVVLVGAGLRHCVVRKGALLSGKKRMYDVEEVNINNFQNYEPKGGEGNGDKSAASLHYYAGGRTHPRLERQEGSLRLI